MFLVKHSTMGLIKYKTDSLEKAIDFIVKETVENMSLTIKQMFMGMKELEISKKYLTLLCLDSVIKFREIFEIVDGKSVKLSSNHINSVTLEHCTCENVYVTDEEGTEFLADTIISFKKDKTYEDFYKKLYAEGRGVVEYRNAGFSINTRVGLVSEDLLNKILGMIYNDKRLSDFNFIR
ncbi:hypothetical protein PQC36_gp091 [Proteus phage Vb_PmiP-P59]|uniref:Uncharacterized protein n=1 Tax=Proteus phage Vb_PmiP-P59 TaxID=2754975 RepID=A0A7G5CG59_9CAUD|nr:hypothetical protein PQC36_gp091 [Proteus phage Vb_PmiP-P59]QMV48261.1 hypothetical protein [Proteus phage Vb_PmiP-P59]